MKKIDLKVTIKKYFLDETQKGDSACKMCFFNTMSHLMHKPCSDDKCHTYGYVWVVDQIKESR